MAINAGDTTYYQAKRGIVQDGLVLNLDAAVDASYPGNGTTWYDLAGSNNGTLTNSPTFDRGEGGSISLDATDDYVDCGNLNIDIADGYTLFIFFKARSLGTDSQLVTRDHSGRSRFWQFKISSGKLKFIRFDASQSVTANFIGSSTLSNGNTYCAAATFSSSVGSVLYLNGNSDGTDSGTTQNNSGTGTQGEIIIGGRGQNGNYPIDPLGAQVYSCSIYNRALTAAEVLQNYNATKGRFQ